MSASVDAYDSRHLKRSKYVSTFAHMGEVYVYHDLYGYILKMSPDILEFLNAFKTPVLPEAVCTEYGNAFGEQTPESFVGVFLQFGCLVTPGQDERDGLWDKVPVKARWNVWERGEDGSLTFYAGWGEREVARHTLTPAEAAIWDAFDSETRLSVLAEAHGAEAVADLVERLAHHEVQAVKLSQVPLSYYKTRQHLKPPYLTSTMPYAPYDPDRDPLPQAFPDTFSPEQYYEEEVHDAEAQFDHQETTLSHLFRVPHPALGGRTYGEALVDALLQRGRIPASGDIRVLEIGGGLGWVAKAVTEALQKRGLTVTYDIVELTPALAEAQRKQTAGLPVTVHMGNAMTVDWPGERYDLVISNEMIGDLPAVRLTHEQLGLDRHDAEDEASDEAWAATLGKLGDAGELVLRYKLPVGDAPDPFYLNIGAMKLLERLWPVVAPGGTAVLTEFGEMGRWPVLSTQLDHPELSIHFGHLSLVARELGFHTDFAFVVDLLGLDTDQEGLATTRSYFKALQALFADHGLSLEKIGYTRPMLEQLADGKLDLERVGDLDFRPIIDRLMGLVPHEFKALVLQRPLDA